VLPYAEAPTGCSCRRRARCSQCQL